MPPPRSGHTTLFTGLDCHYLEWDETNADHTVVLLHGFLDLAWGWAKTAEAGLSARYHVIAPDVRGHGDSGRAGAGGYYRTAHRAGDVRRLLEGAHLTAAERVSVAGDLASLVASGDVQASDALGLVPLLARDADWRVVGASTRLVRDLGDRPVMILRNHGTLVAGETIAQAFSYMFHLEKACQAQLQAMSTGQELVLPPEESSVRTRERALSADSPVGRAEWPALVRMLDRIDPTYRQ